MELIIKKISMNKGALIFGFKCLELQCGIYRLLNHFFIKVFGKPRLKTILEFGEIFGIVGKPSPTLI
jgi:hypothetical protein